MTVFGRIREAAHRIEARRKRRVEEPASKSGSSSEEEEEQEDPANTNNNSEEGEGTETPPQSDLVDKLESSPAFQISKPTTRSTPRRPTARPKHQASKKKTIGPSSSARKSPRR